MSTSGPEHILAPYYDLEHLQPGDQVASANGGRNYEVCENLPAQERLLVRGLTRVIPGSSSMPYQMVGTERFITPGPGRAAGLGPGFWLARWLAEAGPTFDPDAHSVPLSIDGNIRFGRGGEAGHDWVAGPARVMNLRPWSRHTTDGWSIMAANLNVLAALDGGLSPAGTLLARVSAHAPAQRPHNAGDDDALWAGMLASHLNMHTVAELDVLARLSPNWTLPLADLATVAAGILDARASD